MSNSNLPGEFDCLCLQQCISAQQTQLGASQKRHLQAWVMTKNGTGETTRLKGRFALGKRVSGASFPLGGLDWWFPDVVPDVVPIATTNVSQTNGTIGPTIEFHAGCVEQKLPATSNYPSKLEITSSCFPFFFLGGGGAGNTPLLKGCLRV